MTVKWERTCWRIILGGILLVASLLTVGSLAAQENVINLETSAGPLRITGIGHGTLMLEFGNLVIHVDPYSRVGDYAALPKADQIWITHSHRDHLDQAAIDQIKKEGTLFLFVADPTSAEQLGEGRVIAMKNGDKRDIDGGITIEAVPAYNLVKRNHPKGSGNGYVATFGDKRIYIAGDTEANPGMSFLGAIDVAFIPIDGRYTMSPEEAVGCIKVISPKVVIPYHQRESDPNTVAELLEGSDIEVLIWAMP